VFLGGEKGRGGEKADGARDTGSSQLRARGVYCLHSLGLRTMVKEKKEGRNKKNAPNREKKKGEEGRREGGKKRSEGLIPFALITSLPLLKRKGEGGKKIAREKRK